MNASPKLTVSEKRLNLMYITGLMLLIGALPAGLGVAFAAHHDSRDDWHSALILGGVMAIATAIVGGALHGVSRFILNRRLKQKRQAQKDAGGLRQEGSQAKL
jgi:hypothetical protein